MGHTVTIGKIFINIVAFHYSTALSKITLSKGLRDRYIGLLYGFPIIAIDFYYYEIIGCNIRGRWKDRAAEESACIPS